MLTKEDLKEALREVLPEVLREILMELNENQGNTSQNSRSLLKEALSEQQSKVLEMLQCGVSISKTAQYLDVSLTRVRQIRDALEKKGYSIEPSLEVVERIIKRNGWSFTYGFNTEGQVHNNYKVDCPSGNMINVTPIRIYEGKCDCYKCAEKKLREGNNAAN